MDEFEYEQRPRRRSNLLLDILPILACAAVGAGLGAMASSELRDFSQAQSSIGDVVNRDFLSADALGKDRPNLDGRSAVSTEAVESKAPPAPVFPAALVSARAGLAQGDASEALRDLGPGTRRAVLGRLADFSSTVAQ